MKSKCRTESEYLGGRGAEGEVMLECRGRAQVKDGWEWRHPNWGLSEETRRDGFY